MACRNRLLFASGASVCRRDAVRNLLLLYRRNTKRKRVHAKWTLRKVAFPQGAGIFEENQSGREKDIRHPHAKTFSVANKYTRVGRGRIVPQPPFRLLWKLSFCAAPRYNEQNRSEKDKGRRGAGGVPNVSEKNVSG